MGFHSKLGKLTDNHSYLFFGRKGTILISILTCLSASLIGCGNETGDSIEESKAMIQILEDKEHESFVVLLVVSFCCMFIGWSLS